LLLGNANKLEQHVMTNCGQINRNKEFICSNEMVFNQIWSQIWPLYFSLLAQHYSNHQYAKQHYAKLSQLVLLFKSQMEHKLNQLCRNNNSTPTPLQLPKSITDKILLNHPLCARAVWELQLVPFHSSDRFRGFVHLARGAEDVPMSLFPLGSFPAFYPHYAQTIERLIERLYYLRRSWRLYQPFASFNLINIDWEKITLEAILPPLNPSNTTDEQIILTQQNGDRCTFLSLNNANNFGYFPPLEEFRKKYPVDTKPIGFEYNPSVVKFCNVFDDNYITFIPHNFSEFQPGFPDYTFLQSHPNSTENSDSHPVTHISSTKPIHLSITPGLLSQIFLLRSPHCPKLSTSPPIFFKTEKPGIYLPEPYITLLISSKQYNQSVKWRRIVPYLSPSSKKRVQEHLHSIEFPDCYNFSRFRGNMWQQSPKVTISKFETFGLDLAPPKLFTPLQPGQLPNELYFNTSVLIEPRVLSTGLPNLHLVRDLYQFDPYKAFPEALQQDIQDIGEGIIDSLNKDIGSSQNDLIKKKYPRHYQPSPNQVSGNSTKLQHLLQYIDPLIKGTFGKSACGYASVTNTGIPYSKYISPHRCETSVIVKKSDVYNINKTDCVGGADEMDIDGVIDSVDSTLRENDEISSSLATLDQDTSTLDEDTSRLDQTNDSKSINIKITHLVRNDAHYYSHEKPSAHFELFIHPPHSKQFQYQSTTHFHDAKYDFSSGPLSLLGYHGIQMPLLFAIRITPYIFCRISDDLNYNKNVFYPLTAPLFNELALPDWKSDDILHKNINIKLPPFHLYHGTKNDYHFWDYTPTMPINQEQQMQSEKKKKSNHLHALPVGQSQLPLQSSRSSQYNFSTRAVGPVGLDAGPQLHVGTPFETQVEAISPNDQYRANNWLTARPFNMQSLKIPMAFVIFCVNPVVPDDFDNFDYDNVNSSQKPQHNDDNDNIQPYSDIQLAPNYSYSNFLSRLPSPPMKFDYLTQSEFNYLRKKAYYEYKLQIVDVLYHTSPLLRDEAKDLVTVYFISPSEWPQLFLKLQQEGVIIRLSLLGKSLHL
jgi:hypothetical protein